MKINRDNYEEFFLDFAEGNLNAEQEETLNNFLKFNPDLEAELKNLDLYKVQPQNLLLPSKDKLKKEIPSSSDAISSQNFEMYSIAYLENDLTEYQRSLFEAFLNSEQKYKENFKLLKLTYLQPEPVQFPDKSKLKKNSKAAINLRILFPFAAAASIALLIFLRTDFFTVEPEFAIIPEPEVSSKIIEIEPVVKKPPVKKQSPSIQIIRNSQSQVPVSNIKNRPEILHGEIKNIDKETNKTIRISGINPSRLRIPANHIQEDKIFLESQDLPKVNMSSLALADRIRYQLNKASELMDEDDVFIWNLASQGIEEISKRTGADMSLMASQDQEGSVSGFRFKSRFLNVTAPIGRDGY